MRTNPLRFGIAVIAVVVLRVWVENPPGPDDYAIAAKSLAEKIHACTDLELVEISGFPENIIDVRTDPRRLKAYGVAFPDVVSALKKAVPRGLKKRMKANPKDFTIELVSYQYHLDEDLLIKDVSVLTDARVKTKSGAQVSIRDLSSVSVGPGKPQSTHKGVPALYLSVKTGESPARLREVIKQFQSAHPDVRVDWSDEGIKSHPAPVPPDPP